MSDPVLPTQGGREALRGVEVLAFDFIFEVLASQQLAELLTVPLERAAAKGKRDLAQSLFRAGAGIGNALHEAIRGGHGEIASDLVDGGAALDTKHADDGDTPLHAAARHGETEVAELLLLKGADKDVLNFSKETPLYLAAFLGNSAIALALLAAGADTSLRCRYNKTLVIHIAARQGSVEILRAVIERGMDVDDVEEAGNYTALHFASRYNNAGCIDVLLEAGANIEVRNMNGVTPLHVAADMVNHEALLCLLKHGATANAQETYELETPLMHAVRMAGAPPGAAPLVDSLLRAGADETLLAIDGRKPADMIGFFGDGLEDHLADDHLADDVERVRELLANAPADRAWRRRGYLVLCRAHPDRMQQDQATSSDHHTDAARGSRSCAEVARVGEVEGGSGVDESTGDWTVVVSKLLLLQEEGIFRTIVGYL
eukprot:g5911.t1